jgi:hypothetical protein
MEGVRCNCPFGIEIEEIEALFPFVSRNRESGRRAKLNPTFDVTGSAGRLDIVRDECVLQDLRAIEFFGYDHNPQVATRSGCLCERWRSPLTAYAEVVSNQSFAVA